MLMAMMAAVGCTSTQDEPAVPSHDDVCELTITLRAETPRPASRADQPWGEPYPEEIGLPDEYKVDNVALYLVTADNKYLALNPEQAWNNASAYHYKMKVNLTTASYVTRTDDGRYLMSGRIVAMANYPGEATSTNPFDALYNIDVLQATGTIPMWGITSISNLELRVNSSVHAADVKLLRSVAKITIMLDDDIKKDYTITAVKENQGGYNAMAHCQPSGWETAASSDQLMIEGCFNPVTNITEKALSFYRTGNDKVYCYVAERWCNNQGVFPLSLNVTLQRNDGTEPPFTGKIYLCDYEDGQPVADTGFEQLVRNHDYQFRLKLTPLDFIVSFKKWIWGGKVHLELE